MISDESRLGADALALVRDVNNRLFLSIASEWEIAIKVGNNRLFVGFPLDELLTTVPRRFNIDVLAIRPEHLLAVASLPKYHGDPFDRLLAAQCLVENIPMVSADAALDQYGITRIW
jgi:PIN domain nuclease of toxin-antitoxin system